MTVNVTIPVYQRKREATLEWTTLGLGVHTLSRSANSAHKIEQALVDSLRKRFESLPPRDLGAFELKRGTQLVRARLEVSLKGEKRRKVSGLFPFIVEPHAAAERVPFLIAYHPARQSDWFPVRDEDAFEEQASLFLGHILSDTEDGEIEALLSNGRDSVRILSFSANARSVLDLLKTKKKGIWDDLKVDPTRGAKEQPGALKALPKIGTDWTPRLVTSEPPGVPRSPYREQLQSLLGLTAKRPTILVGEPGVGKTTILRRWIADLALLEDYPSHKNLDRIHHVWHLTGRQLIAGMSHVGDWEQRCVDLLDDVRPRKVIVYVPDLYLFGRIGRTRDSERSLADFFRGPVLRGEIVLVGECSPAQLRRLEDDAPSFAALFSRLRVHPTTEAQTFRMMVHEARGLELAHKVAFEPHAYRTALELCRSLLTAESLPGSALDLLRRVAAEGEGPRARNGGAVLAPTSGGSIDGLRKIEADDVLAHVSARTGIPWILLEREKPLSFSEIEAELRERVLGQPEAVAAAANLVTRIRAGLVDATRPYGVYLFTGPTGTGKTELAKCVAEYLYGSTARLIRLDMSEYATPDAVARLIGDAWTPEGILTRALIEQPFSVVLFDEIEKAHPSVHNLLLQLFDEGRLTDAAGTMASFRHAVVILTSNLGARSQPALGFGVAPEAVMQDVARAVREFFAPELFNRIDHVVPFRPLAEDVARGVVRKELGKLLNRRGLTDRDIFVRATDAVADHVARVAFRSEDGARALKRYIEDEIGSRLSEAIVRAPSAALQVLTLFEADGRIDVDQVQLVEAPAAGGAFALEPLLDRTLEELRAEAPTLLPILDAIEASSDREALSERIRHHLGEHNLGRREQGALLYNLEWVRMHVASLRHRLELMLVESRESAYDDIERDRFRHQTVPEAYGPKTDSRRYQLFARNDGRARGQPSRQELLECFAEIHFLRRAVARAHEEQEHAVFLEIVQVSEAGRVGFARAPGTVAGRGLVPWLARAYAAARGELDAFAAVTAGKVTSGLDRATLDHVLGRGTSHVVLKIVGPCVADFFELEAGTHVWHPLAKTPEIVRVRVVRAEGNRTPRALIEDHLAAKVAFERDPTSPNPLAIPPIARVIRFEPPKDGGPPSRIEIDDYILGYTGSFTTRSVEDALAPLWLLRLSRTDGPVAPQIADGDAR